MMRLASVGAPARARGTRVARTRKRTRTDLVQATLRAEDRDVAVIPRAASARHRGRALDPARRARRLTGRMGRREREEAREEGSVRSKKTDRSAKNCGALRAKTHPVSAARGGRLARPPHEIFAPRLLLDDSSLRASSSVSPYASFVRSGAHHPPPKKSSPSSPRAFDPFSPLSRRVRILRRRTRTCRRRCSARRRRRARTSWPPVRRRRVPRRPGWWRRSARGSRATRAWRGGSA